MKRAILFLSLSATAFVTAAAITLLRPPQFRTSDETINQLNARKTELQHYKLDLPKTEDARVAVQVALWSPRQLADFAAELPKDWNYRPISSDRQDGVTMQRIALSKEMVLRDYSEFVRVLKKLESHRGTRIDSITLAIGADGKKFTSSLITATLPTAQPETPPAAHPATPPAPAAAAPQPAAAPTTPSATAQPQQPAAIPTPAVAHPAAMPKPTS